jgi:hypothetical protein
MSGETIHPQASQSTQRWPFPYPGESESRFALRTKRDYGDMPEAYHLHRIGWQVMGHLTFKQSRLPGNIPRKMFRATMRKLCKRHRLYFPDLMWALRSELGTRKDLCPHFHFLLAALPGQIDLARFCQDCKAAWLAFGGGISRVEPYTRQLDGAGYLAKRPHTGQDPVGDDCELTFSDAALDYLRRVVKRERGI